ncbi:unnamed protein product [Lampetra planeri]
MPLSVAAAGAHGSARRSAPAGAAAGPPMGTLPRIARWSGGVAQRGTRDAGDVACERCERERSRRQRPGVTRSGQCKSADKLIREFDNPPTGTPRCGHDDEEQEEAERTGE